MEKVHGQTFNRILWELSRTRIVLLGGEGGFDRVDVMDVTDFLHSYCCSTNSAKAAAINSNSVTWEAFPSMPRERSGFGCVYRQGEIVVANRGTVERLDVVAKRWVQVAQRMPLSLEGVSAVEYDATARGGSGGGGRIYITGGCEEDPSGENPQPPTTSVL